MHRSFLKEQAHCTGLSGKVRFECIRSFCYAAKDETTRFMAVVESDEGQGQTNSSRKRKEKSKGEVRGSKRAKKGRDGDGSVDELQES